MLNRNLLPPHVSINTLRHIMTDAFRAPTAAELDELFTPNPVLLKLREADGDTFADELDAHGPFSCITPECDRIRCVALKADILARHYGEVA